MFRFHNHTLHWNDCILCFFARSISVWFTSLQRLNSSIHNRKVNSIYVIIHCILVMYDVWHIFFYFFVKCFTFYFIYNVTNHVAECLLLIILKNSYLIRRCLVFWSFKRLLTIEGNKYLQRQRFKVFTTMCNKIREILSLYYYYF